MSKSTPKPLTLEEIEELDSLCRQKLSDPFCFGISVLDGFLTYCASSGQTPGPYIMMNAIIGELTYGRISDLITRHYQSIEHQLETAPLDLVPVITIYEEGEANSATDIQLWGVGYLYAADLYPIPQDQLPASYCMLSVFFVKLMDQFEGLDLAENVKAKEQEEFAMFDTVIKRDIPEEIVPFLTALISAVYLEVKGESPDSALNLMDLILQNPYESLSNEQKYSPEVASFLQNVKEQGIESIGRNDLCPCGSGKKFKKCCMNHF
ncbi:MAG: UPF0149 family protein [Lentisphaeria bacterium]|nr:UPF0149 family protein [Lentisphaeria bacterium]